MASLLLSLFLSISEPLTSPRQSNPPAPGACPCFGTARCQGPGQPRGLGRDLQVFCCQATWSGPAQGKKRTWRQPRVGPASEWSVSLKRKRRITKNRAQLRAQLLSFPFLDKVSRSGQHWQSKAWSWTLCGWDGKAGLSQTPASHLVYISNLDRVAVE